MPPRKRKAVATPAPVQITTGAGITAGLELWLINGSTFVLHDRTPDHRFAPDVATWNTAANCVEGVKLASNGLSTKPGADRTASD